VIGVLFIGLFFAVTYAYGCTEFLLGRFDPDRSRSLSVILKANFLSFLILWVSSLAVVLASGAQYYLLATIAAACAQAMWLAQHLWAYYRDHPRLRYEN
jgi:cytosine/uracil/thiamine/allantoin permease